MGMQGATGVAQGAGGGKVTTSPGNSDSESEGVECSKCGRTNAPRIASVLLWLQTSQLTKGFFASSTDRSFLD